jgi:hypothetical protein
MRSLTLLKKPSLAFSFAVVLFGLATHVEGQRAIASLGSRLKRFGSRIEKGTKGKLVVAEGENHFGKRTYLFSNYEAAKPWNSCAIFVSLLVAVLVFWCFPRSEVPEQGEYFRREECGRYFRRQN